jgi:hypothetical protein
MLINSSRPNKISQNGFRESRPWGPNLGNLHYKTVWKKKGRHSEFIRQIEKYLFYSGSVLRQNTDNST